MMKRLLVLTAVVLLSVSALGCRSCGGLFQRGPACGSCGTAGGASYGGDAYLAPPSVPPETYAVPGPG
jgi:hypothetical protein